MESSIAQTKEKLSGFLNEDQVETHLISFVKSHKNENSHLENSRETRNEGDAAVLSLLCSAAATFDCCESNGFYYIAGWSVYKELQSIDCNQCKLFYSVDEPDPYLKKFSSLTTFKSYKAYPDSCATNYLCHPSKLIFDILHQTEIVFRNEVNNVIRSICPEERIIALCKYDMAIFPQCHVLIETILRRYVKLRFNIYAKELCKKLCSSKQFASKTAARSTCK